MVVFCLFVLAGCSGSGSKLRKPLNWDLETFQFTNQDGKQFGTKDLKGKVWVADFMFTNCQSLSTNDCKYGQAAKDGKREKIDVQFVSFSVDPDLDKPEKSESIYSKVYRGY
ncbi:SCO family protein [Bacillus sp. CB102A.1]